MRIALVGVIITALAGCDSTPDERISAVCTTFCRCDEPPLPSRQDACVSDCTSDLQGVGFQISEECAACISGHATQCATLESDCQDICDIDDTPEPEPEPPIIVDAGFGI